MHSTLYSLLNAIIMNSIISATGSYIPTEKITNNDFLNAEFYDENKVKLPNSNEIIVKKFEQITGIRERRYVSENLTNSEIATFAAQIAIEKSGIDVETLDYIILAQNFGNVTMNNVQCDMLPSIASRVKQNLKIKNPNCVAYDIIFGCPGWLQALIQADAFIKAGIAKRCLVIGSETLSRVVDKHDRDSMIYSDGAGACILEASAETKKGILSHASQSHTLNEALYLYYGTSFNPSISSNTNYIKMYGRKIYEFALTHVPNAMKIALDKSGIRITDLKKILIHQANEKMDEAIVQRFYELYDEPMPNKIMPMSIHKLGNSSVATVPTLLDLILNKNLPEHEINDGDVVLLASVGAGMNINALVYQF